MRFLLLCAALATTLAWAKGDDVRTFEHDGQQGTVTVRRVAADPARAIDFVIVSDGYSAKRKERKRFEGDAKTVRRLFKEVEPFETYRDLFTVHEVFLPVASEDATRLGVTIPFPEPRNRMEFEEQRLKDLLAAAGLADAKIVHVIYDVDRFGGTAYSGEGVSISSRNKSELNDILNMGLLWTVAHELGHSVAALVEERPGAGLGPSRECMARASALPNAFALREGQLAPTPDQAPWAEWLPSDPKKLVVVPHDDDYDYSKTFHPDKRAVGFFAGAASMPGAFRAQEHCLMRSDTHKFCVSCRQALIRAFVRLAQPLRLEATLGDELELGAISALPEKHLRLSWSHVDPAVQALLAEANRKQRWSVTLPSETVGVVVELVDETPWVRGGSPHVHATYPAPSGGAVGALEGAAAAEAEDHELGEPHACWGPPAPAEAPQSPANLPLGQ